MDKQQQSSSSLIIRSCIECKTNHAPIQSDGKGRRQEKWYRWGPEKIQWLCLRCYKKITRATTRHYRRLKIKIFTHYFGPDFCCVDCGIKDIRVLTMDHVNGGGNQQRIEIFGTSHKCGGKFYEWLHRKGYPDIDFKCRCANCHLIIEQERIEAKYR